LVVLKCYPIIQQLRVIVARSPSGSKKNSFDFMRIGRLETLADAVGRDAAAVTAEPWPG
jgi:hypothetical protein